MDGLLSFLPRGKGSDHQICGNGFAKPCNVLLSHSKKGYEEVNECGAQFWWSRRGILEVCTGSHEINFAVLKMKGV